jgi:hypothetical protein
MLVCTTIALPEINLGTLSTQSTLQNNNVFLYLGDGSFFVGLFLLEIG